MLKQHQCCHSNLQRSIPVAYTPLEYLQMTIRLHSQCPTSDRGTLLQALHTRNPHQPVARLHPHMWLWKKVNIFLIIKVSITLYLGDVLINDFSVSSNKNISNIIFTQSNKFDILAFIHYTNCTVNFSFIYILIPHENGFIIAFYILSEA